MDVDASMTADIKNVTRITTEIYRIKMFLVYTYYRVYIHLRFK